MNPRYRHATMLAVVLGLAAALPAAARDTHNKFEMKPILASEAARKAIGNMPISFGSKLPNGLLLVDERMVGTGKVDPRVWPVVTRLTMPPMTDEEACTGAFVKALGDLVRQARKANATSLVGVVSIYGGKEVDSTESFECHSGYSNSVVELKGMAAVQGQGNAPTIARTAVAPPAPAAPAPPVGTAHRSAVPQATGFARGDDANSVPLSEAGRARYRHYLTLPSPKAFVIYDTGAWRFYSDDPDAMTKALDYCASERKTCWLYAVDDRVVWTDNVGKRIAKSGQLGNE